MAKTDQIDASGRKMSEVGSEGGRGDWKREAFEIRKRVALEIAFEIEYVECYGSPVHWRGENREENVKR